MKTRRKPVKNNMEGRAVRGQEELLKELAKLWEELEGKKESLTPVTGGDVEILGKKSCRSVGIS